MYTKIFWNLGTPLFGCGGGGFVERGRSRKVYFWGREGVGTGDEGRWGTKRIGVVCT